MKTWCVYLLRCKDGSVYTGITNDLQRRLHAHETGKGAKYTRGRAPFNLIYHETCPNRSAASKREAHIRSLSHKEKLVLSGV